MNCTAGQWQKQCQSVLSTATRALHRCDNDRKAWLQICRKKCHKIVQLSGGSARTRLAGQITHLHKTDAHPRPKNVDRL